MSEFVCQHPANSEAPMAFPSSQPPRQISIIFTSRCGHLTDVQKVDIRRFPPSIPSIMSRLISLSNEIVYNIIAFVRPDDIEAFAATCCALRTLSTGALLQHRRFKQKYTTIECGEWGSFEGPHPMFFLRDLYDDPQIAYYPRNVNIGYHYEDPWLPDFDDEEVETREEARAKVQEIADGCKDFMTKTVRECQFIDEAEVDDWTERLMNGGRDETLAILLDLLPNLENINIEGNPSTVFYDMVEKIATAYHTPGVSSSLPLAKLSRAVISPSNEEGSWDGPYEDFDVIGSFAALPSIRSISGMYLISGQVSDDNVYQWPYGSRASRLTEVNLDRSTAIDTSLPNLIGGIDSLQKFTYSLGGYLRDYQKYQPYMILGALQKYAFHSLTSLHLTGSCIGMLSDGDAMTDFDLKSFLQAQTPPSRLYLVQ